MSVNPLAPEQIRYPSDINALHAGIWPETATRTPAGELQIGGVTVSALADSFGTPLYVVDAVDFEHRMHAVSGALRDAFREVGTEATVYYAGKVFLTGTIVEWVERAGLNLDVCTAGEMQLAFRAGFPAERMGLHGNNKSDEEIDLAVSRGVRGIVMDSESEIERVAAAAQRHGVRQGVRLRVNSGVHASTHEYLATAREDQKFGVALADAGRLARSILASPHLEFLGLHSHIGSQITDTPGFDEAARRLLAVHAEISREAFVPELNLGGGFGIRYIDTDPEVDIERIARGIARVAVEECERLGISMPRFVFEPGRIIAGPSTITLYRAGVTKEIPLDAGNGERASRRYIAVDGGMSDNLRTALYHADYAARLASRASDAEPALSRMVGKHCESGDIVVDAEYLPSDVSAGDLVAVAATGAYCHSLSNTYNLVPRPAIVSVRDGRVDVMLRRETIDDLLDRDERLGPSTT